MGQPVTGWDNLLGNGTTNGDNQSGNEDGLEFMFSTPEYGSSTMKGRPILFHRVHSENIQLSLDQHRAKRIESFCKGICFSDRSISVNERVHLKFAEVSTSWSGVVRVGFTSHDPVTINPAELPRYACPDLTYKPGYWAKALPERYAEQGTTLFYYLTRSGDVMFGINGEEKGIFFSSVATNCNLWALIDIYGNTTCMEFVDGWQLNNLGTNSALSSGGSVIQDLEQAFQHSLSIIQPTTPQPVLGHQTSSLPMLPISMVTHQNPASIGSLSIPPVTYHLDAVFAQLPFHHTMGHNVCLSSDRNTAVRLVEEYCNGYVFTNRPLLCGEKLVIQILSLQNEYTGGLAFGMTSCDPITISPDELPDDSDLLLDRPEYWVVNKDVCTTPEVGDELSFHLTTEGEVRYGKNGHYITTLMYIDKTLPMWAFFDVYGNTQKIHCLAFPFSVYLTPAVPVPGSTSQTGEMQRSPKLVTGLAKKACCLKTGAGSCWCLQLLVGVISPGVRCSQGSGLTVALPPPRNASVCSLPVTTSSGAVTPPPRPPPPRASPSGSIGHGASPSTRLKLEMMATQTIPPSLPPKHFKPTLQSQPLHPAELMQSPRVAGSPLPPPLVPTPLRPPPTPPERHGTKPSPRLQQPPVRLPKPAPPMSPMVKKVVQQEVPPATPINDHYDYDESCDNESNECKVCMNNAVDCVLYTCGHMCLCYECAQDIKNKHNLCPICRQEIRDIIRIYRS
ncbi:hypothetical protein LSH36_75g04037 [Paralvinella palmiformis]|uniref:Neuralized n=1 Tax=Paralvinella palmiformis TaxID=53620 RepID=A0AAD9NCM5_9ANNE|nr:hypothetical protein LSH36_75g04037 [Paralvinella palmiformis]